MKPLGVPVFCFRLSTFDLRRAFTLIEMLVVISIIGILAGLAVPALKNLGKSNVNISAARQLLDGVGRARQLAIANHTTVYMVFVPTNFWLPPFTSSPTWHKQFKFCRIRCRRQSDCDKQLSGYTFVSHGTVGRPARTTCLALSRAVAESAERNIYCRPKIRAVHKPVHSPMAN